MDLPAPQSSQPIPLVAPSSAAPESDSDDLSIPVPAHTTCRRRGCNATSPLELPLSRSGEECVYHPGQALFHEGSKGWTCCKRRVLEFEEFMKIKGCKRRKNHLFVGSKTQSLHEEAISEVRYVTTVFGGGIFETYGCVGLIDILVGMISIRLRQVLLQAFSSRRSTKLMQRLNSSARPTYSWICLLRIIRDIEPSFHYLDISISLNLRTRSWALS